MRISRRAVLTVPEIPLNTYQLRIRRPRRPSIAHLVRIYRDMVVIREFETMLGSYKPGRRCLSGHRISAQGTAHFYDRPGGIAVVGQAYNLTPDDSSLARTAARRDSGKGVVLN